MTITVFGASGSIGKLLVKQAIEEGYFVKAFVRNASKIDFKHPNLELIEGELHDYEKIKEAVHGVHCVISTLGPPVARSYEGFSVLEGHKNILHAMKAKSVNRFITIATPSVKFKKDVPSFTTKFPTLMAKLFLPKAYQEIVQIGDIVSNSGLDWTIVRFIAPKNTPAKGKIKVTFGDIKIKFGISRADIAAFILAQTKDRQYIQSMPIIGSF